MSAELYSGTIAEFVKAKRYRPARDSLEGIDCVRVVDIRDRGGEIVAASQLVTLCNRLRALGPELGDVLQFMGTLKTGRGFFFDFRKLPPR